MKTKLILSAILSPILMLFDPYTALVKAIGILVIFDIVTGIIAAKKENKDITSRGFFRKLPQVGLFLVALAAASVGSPLLAEFGIEAHQSGKWLCAMYGAYELFSILENLGRLGLPVAKQLQDLLKSKLPDEMKNIEVPKE